MALRGILFDIDGTLVDSDDAHARAWTEALQQNGHSVPYEQVRRLIGMGSDNLLPETAHIEKDSPEGKKLSEAWKQIFQSRFQENIVAFPNVRDLLQRVRNAGLMVVIATSGEQELMDAMLERAGVKDLVQITVSSSDAKNSKPAPDLVQTALQKAGLEPAEALMVGDTPYDVQAAGKAGVRTVALRCGGWNDADLQGAAALYDDPADLLSHFDDLLKEF